MPVLHASPILVILYLTFLCVMNFSPDILLQFISDYQSYDFLWDSKHKDYANRKKRIEALQAIGGKYSMNVPAVKGKIKSLRSYFSKEHQKVMKKNSGDGVEGIHVSPWFAYDSMLFIADSMSPKETKDTDYLVIINPEKSDEEELEDSQVSLKPLKVTPSAPTPTGKNSHTSLQKIQSKINLIKPNTRSTQNREGETHDFLKLANDSVLNKDESSIFGSMVATKIRKLSPRNQAIAQNHISNYLFELEIQELDKTANINQKTESSET